MTAGKGRYTSANWHPPQGGGNRQGQDMAREDAAKAAFELICASYDAPPRKFLWGNRRTGVIRYRDGDTLKTASAR